MGLHTHMRTGEQVLAIDGGHEDERLAASSDWASDGQPPAPVPRPAESARKTMWEAYALDEGVPEVEVEAMTKAELIARCSGAETS